MWEECHGTKKLMKVEAEELAESLTSEKVACLVCPLTKSSPKRVHRELDKLSTMSNSSTHSHQFSQCPFNGVLAVFARYVGCNKGGLFHDMFSFCFNYVFSCY